MQLLYSLIFIPVFISCSADSNHGCIKRTITENDWKSHFFHDLPDTVTTEIFKLAAENKLDTALSLDRRTSYVYENPGDGKGYLEQVVKNTDMHNINGKCYEFLLGAKPYIIYQGEIFFFEQRLLLNCSGPRCVPDTTGINEEKVFSISLKQILEKAKP
jgi:hypothetical protein